MKTLFGLLSTAIVLSSCAASYNTINPKGVNYTAKSEETGVVLNYRHAVLEQHGNKKYAKKEDKNGVKLVAISLQNTTHKEVSFNDLSFHAGSKKVFPLEISTLHKELKQNVAVYLLYLLFTPMNVYTSSSNGEVNNMPVGLAVGPGLTAINMGTAANANKDFKEELLKNDLTNATIGKGETVYGIIGFRDIGYDPLTIKIENKELRSNSVEVKSE